MQLIDLLDKTELRKLTLLRHLEDATNLKVNDVEEKASLELSDYLYTKMVTELSDDLKRFYLDGVMQLTHENGMIILAENGQATSELLLRAYLQEAASFLLLDAVVKGELTSLAEFADAHYLGYWVVKSRFRTLRVFLKQWDLGIDNSFHFQGPAQQLRLVLTAVYVFVRQRPVEAATAELTQAVAQFKARPAVSLSAYAEMVVRQFLLLAPLAPDATADAAVADLLAPVLPELQPLAAYLASRVPNSDNDGLVQELAVYLVSNQVLELPLAPAVTAPLLQATGICDFLTTVTAHFHPAAALQDQLATRCYQLLLAYQVFPLNEYLMRERVDVGYFQESYPEYFSLVRTFINRQRDQEGLIWRYRVSLFYRLLLILIDLLPLGAVVAPVKVCINFSLGPEYDAYLQRNLKFFTTLNLAFSPVVTSDLDILLTDVPELAAPELETVVWLQPPRPVDWENLARLLVELRDAKRVANVTNED